MIRPPIQIVQQAMEDAAHSFELLGDAYNNETLSNAIRSLGVYIERLRPRTKKRDFAKRHKR